MAHTWLEILIKMCSWLKHKSRKDFVCFGELLWFLKYAQSCVCDLFIVHILQIIVCLCILYDFTLQFICVSCLHHVLGGIVSNYSVQYYSEVIRCFIQNHSLRMGFKKDFFLNDLFLQAHEQLHADVQRYKEKIEDLEKELASTGHVSKV